MLFSYDNLANYYKTNFAMVQHHKYSLAEIEGMLPWERAIYIDMLNHYIEQENQKERDRQALRTSQRRL